MLTLEEYLADLKAQHDIHMKEAYEHLVAGSDDVTEMYAYGAGLLHAIRTIEEFLQGV